MSATETTENLYGPGPTHPSLPGGAWEVIVDHAITEVTKYLAATTKAFDPTAPLARCMLLLLDQSTHRDVLVERNFNGLCGRLGCAGVPMGLSGSQKDHISFEWHQQDSDNAGGSSLPPCESIPASRAAATAAGAVSVPEESEEIVYDDDLFTQESFRLAERQRLQLERMTRKQREEREAARAGGCAPRTMTRVVIEGTSMLGASLLDRFCSPECMDTYENVLQPAVHRYFQYGHPDLPSCLSNLFPNLRTDVLHRLAGAEAQAGLAASVIEKAVRAPDEGHTDGKPLPPVRVDVSYEDSRTRRSISSSESPSRPVTKKETGQDTLLVGMLKHMKPTGRLWESQVVWRLPRSTCLSVAERVPDLTTQGAPSNTGRRETPATFNPCRPSSLSGALFIIDTVMTISSNTTKRVFLQCYRAHRQALLQVMGMYDTVETVFTRVVRPIMVDLERRATTLSSSSFFEPKDEEGAADLVAHPQLQQQRRELFASHVLSTKTAIILSQLLQFDYDILLSVAWRSVWLSGTSVAQHGSRTSAGSSQTSHSLLNSLTFPFSLPAVLLRPAATTPEVLGLAMVCLVAVSCCDEALWHEFCGASAKVDEVIDALGISEEDLLLAVRRMVLPE